MTTIVAAMIGPHGISKPPAVVVANLNIASGTVCLSGVWVNDSANRNSFQARDERQQAGRHQAGATSGSMTLYSV